MMTKRIFVFSCLILVSIWLAPTEASASLVELRASYALQKTEPKEMDSHFSSSLPKLDSLQGFGADALIMLPAFPFGIGVRYEKFMAENSMAGTTGEASFDRVSVLANKRFIDTGLYLGLIASVGLSNSFEYEVRSASTTTKYKADSGFSGSAGVEAGLNLVVMKIGLEAGMLFAPLGNLKNAAGTEVTTATGAKVKVDLSGTYLRALVGIGF